MNFNLLKDIFRSVPKKAAAAAVGGAAAVAIFATPYIKTDEGRAPYVQTDVGPMRGTYIDIAGVATYCDGETTNAKVGNTYTDAECDAITQKRVLEFAQGVDDLVKQEMPFCVHAGFTRNAYNTGLYAFKRSSILVLANEGKFIEACNFMMNYICITVPAGKGDYAKKVPAGDPQKLNGCVNKAHSKRRVQGLFNRRARERDMCLGVKIGNQCVIPKGEISK